MRPCCGATLATMMIVSAACQSPPSNVTASSQTPATQSATLNPAEQGSAHDGGYVMCDNLVAGAEAAYSYGIGTEDNWGCEVATRIGRPVRQYDCFTRFRDALLATPDTVLERIDQMPMELHGVNEQRIVEVVRRLKRTFYLANLHFNNWACSTESDPLPAPAFQVLWVNKRLVESDPTSSAPSATGAPNAPDNPKGPECQLQRP